MCVNTEHNTCCCCSLTTATYVLGVFQILGTLSLACTENWGSFAISAVTSLFYILICMDKHNVDYRKWLFQLVSLGMIVNIVFATIVFFITLFSDSWISEVCYGSTSYNCADVAKSGLIMGYCISMTFFLLISFLVWQVLFYGWKEQEQKSGDSHHDEGYNKAHDEKC